MLDKEMSAAWLVASRELGIEVLAPHRIRLADGGMLDVEAFLPGFGGPTGTIALTLDAKDRSARAATTEYFVSRLAPSYRTFDVQLFRDTLNDWGWFGSERQRPAWYTGKPWS
jgi:hypothetical protein